MFRRLAIATLFAALLGFPATAAAQSKPTSEKLYYDISWGYAKVANMKLHVGCQRTNYRPAALVAKSRGIANQIHAFFVRLDSFMHPEKGLSLQGRTRIKEDGFTRSYKSQFSDDPGVEVTKTYKGKTSQQAHTLPALGHDLLSWMLDLREKKHETGKSYSYLVWDGWKLFRLKARVRGIEDVWTELGVKKAHAISIERHELHHKGEEKFEPKKDAEDIGTIWFSTDAHHAPVAMDFLAPVGKAKIVLARREIGTCK